MRNRLFQYIILPEHISDLERQYLGRVNRVGLWFLALHLPLFVLVAWYNEQSVAQACSLTLLVLVGPALAYRTLRNPRTVTLVYGFAAMLLGGVLVHLGQGPVQIEMHFYFFALLALLVLFGNPLVVVVAALTVVAHHVTLWLYLPSSVFNYAAPFWVVLVHALFILLESCAACSIARSFFDNAIGLEMVVQARTEQLHERNRHMRLVLDTVNQGFLTIDRALVMSAEKSAVLGEWFGPAHAQQTFTAYLREHDAEFVQRFEVAWEQVIADVLPLALTIDQLPQRFMVVGQHFRAHYTPIEQAGVLTQVLVSISDISAELDRERLEFEQRDVLQIVARVSSDKAGVLEFVREASELVKEIVSTSLTDALVLQRLLHTLKGNALLFGVQTVADVCHELESRVQELGQVLELHERQALHVTWMKLCTNIDVLLGSSEAGRIEIDDAEYEALLRAVLRAESSESLAERIRAWKLEPSARRLNRVAEQAQDIARRLRKNTLLVRVEDHALRLDPRAWASFWSAFVHVIRNAVDHGIESPEERLASGKPAAGNLALVTRLEQSELVIQIEDDGRGIDWQSVALRAQRVGLPFQTEDDLVEALFADGVSTRNDVSEYSGRGIGMGVVREACRARSGRICVSSQRGRGTRMEFRFPRTAVGEIQLARAS